MGESVTKGKKIRKESGFPFWIREVFFLERDFFFLCKETQKWRKRGDFPPIDLGGSLGKANIYTWEMKKKAGGFFDCQGWKGAQEWEKGDYSQGSAKYASCSFYFLFFILVFPFTFHSRFYGCFREVILADWSGHWGPLICFVESKFPSSLLCYDCVLDFSDFFIINSWNRDLCLNFNVCGI